MSLLIEGLSLPKNEDGSFWVPNWEVTGVQIGYLNLSIMLDQKTNTLEIWTSQYDQNRYGLKEKYKVVEVKD